MFSIAELIKVLSPLDFKGNKDAFFSKVVPFDKDNTDPDVLMWIGASKNNLLDQVAAGTIICEHPGDVDVSPTLNIVSVPNARSAFRQVLTHFYAKPSKIGIHPTAVIDPSAIIGKGCSIGAFVVIEENVVIGNGSIIGHHTVIGNGTVVENDVLIGTHCSIGGDGFGYEKDEAGHYIQIPHIGYVHIKQFADIGNNTCIDRGTLGTTTIGAYSRIDNLVHIAHNAQIGDDTLIIAQAMVAGSCEIGNNVWIAPCAAILNKVNVADGAKIGMGAMVFRNVESGETVMGNPARVTKAM